MNENGRISSMSTSESADIKQKYKKSRLRRCKTLTDIVAECKEESIVEIKKLLNLINSNGIKNIKPNELLNMKKENNLKISDDIVFSFFNRISESEVTSHFSINNDLLHKSFERLNQQLKLIKPEEMPKRKSVKESQIIDYLSDLETKDDGFMIFRNINRELYKSFSEFLKTLEENFGDKKLDEKMALEVDDIKAKLKENEVYINDFIQKSNDKYSKLMLLKDYIIKLEHNTQSFDDLIAIQEQDKHRSKSIEPLDELNRLMDENHNLNTLVSSLRTENKEVAILLSKKDKEIQDLQDELDKIKSEMCSLFIENENLNKKNKDFKLEIENLTENLLLVKPDETKAITPFQIIDDSPEKKFSDGLEKINLSPIGSPLRIRPSEPLRHKKSDSQLLKGASEEQRKYIQKLEYINKNLGEKIAIYEKAQNYYEQKIFLMNKENERIKDKLASNNDLSKSQRSPSLKECCTPVNPLNDLSAVGNESLVMISETTNNRVSPTKSMKSVIEHEDYGGFNLNLNNFVDEEFEGQFNTQKILKSFTENNNDLSKLSSKAIENNDGVFVRRAERLNTEERLGPIITSPKTPIKNKRVYTTYKKPNSNNKLLRVDNFSIELLSHEKDYSVNLWTDPNEKGKKQLGRHLKNRISTYSVNFEEHMTFREIQEESMNAHTNTNIHNRSSSVHSEQVYFNSKAGFEAKEKERNNTLNNIENPEDDFKLNRSIRENNRESLNSVDEAVFTDIENLINNPHYSCYDYVELEYNNEIVSIIEQNKEKIREIKIFSDNIFIYDDKLMKIPQYFTLVITYEYVYIFDPTTNTMRGLFKLKDLYKISISNKNCNLICLHFNNCDDLMFDTFRRMHLLHFFRDLFVIIGLGKLLFKSAEHINLKIQNKDYRYVPTSLGMNLYSCHKVGYLDKYCFGFLKNTFQERFAVLSNAGLLLFENPNEKPEVISIIGTDIKQIFEEKKYKRKYCFEIRARENDTAPVVLGSKNNVMVLSWIKELFKVKMDFSRQMKSIKNMCLE